MGLPDRRAFSFAQNRGRTANNRGGLFVWGKQARNRQTAGGGLSLISRLEQVHQGPARKATQSNTIKGALPTAHCGRFGRTAGGRQIGVMLFNSQEQQPAGGGDPGGLVTVVQGYESAPAHASHLP